MISSARRSFLKLAVPVAMATVSYTSLATLSSMCCDWRNDYGK
jgi:hypothetical protein